MSASLVSSHSIKRTLLLVAEQAGMAQVLRSMLAYHCKNREGAIRAYSLNQLMEPLAALRKILKELRGEEPEEEVAALWDISPTQPMHSDAPPPLALPGALENPPAGQPDFVERDDDADGDDSDDGSVSTCDSIDSNATDDGCLQVGIRACMLAGGEIDCDIRRYVHKVSGKMHKGKPGAMNLSACSTVMGSSHLLLAAAAGAEDVDALEEGQSHCDKCFRVKPVSRPLALP